MQGQTFKYELVDPNSLDMSKVDPKSRDNSNLDPNHSHFILVNSAIREWGEEVEYVEGRGEWGEEKEVRQVVHTKFNSLSSLYFWCSFLNNLRIYLHKTVGIPVIVIVLNGGIVTLQAVNGIHNSTPHFTCFFLHSLILFFFLI